MTTKREQLFNDRKELQQKLRSLEGEKQQTIINDFDQFTKNRSWPEKTAWDAAQTQGIGFLVIEPERMRNVHPIVVRNKKKYEVLIGSGKETEFDSKENRFSIAANTISGDHAKLYFSKENGRTKVEIEDHDSLNGTFILRRPGVNSKTRPLLEKEVRGGKFDLSGVQYIRLGPVCVIALEATTVFWDDDTGEEAEGEVESDNKTDEVSKMISQGWYFPLPVKQLPA
eukprot:c12483_g1_i1.p1 GENE.c12483_g1_i1~~c12483_g1_i1.p1  ORF type:complete len:227 (-),score=104.21 c12483_g1_i1:22-702(-)